MTQQLLLGVSSYLHRKIGLSVTTWRILFVLTALIYGLGCVWYLCTWYFFVRKSAQCACGAPTNKSDKYCKACGKRLHLRGPRTTAAVTLLIIYAIGGAVLLFANVFTPTAEAPPAIPPVPAPQAATPVSEVLQSNNPSEQVENRTEPEAIPPPVPQTKRQTIPDAKEPIKENNSENASPANIPESSAVIFSQDFERDLDNWTQQYSPSAERSTEHFRSGNYSLKSVSRLSGIIRQVPENLDKVTYTCYFYDSGASSEGARCAVSISAAIDTTRTISLGTNTDRSKDYYILHQPNGTGWVPVDRLRTNGWHRVDFEQDGQFQRVYLDGRIVTYFNFPQWTHVFAFMEDMGSPQPAYFDDLEVRRT